MEGSNFQKENSLNRLMSAEKKSDDGGEASGPGLLDSYKISSGWLGASRFPGGLR